MNYHEAVSRIYSLEFWGIKLGLDNIEQFARRLGNPHKKFPSIHIAGTNGKGSVTALLDSILRTAGYRVGRYTSPHLRDFRERIHVQGRPVAQTDVADFVRRHWPAIHRERYTYFETVTAMAFDLFARQHVDVGVIEVGLGGRFDATNIVRPVLSIITNIDLDHTEVLGNTRREIALEKAGIIKEGTPVVIGPLVPTARRAIENVARDRNAPLWSSDEILGEFTFPRYKSLMSTRWQLPLPGDHQAANLGVALAASLVLSAHGFHLTVPQLRQGVRNTCWPARFQIIPGRPTMVFDVAHNAPGVLRVVATWRKVFGRRRAVLVFTARGDKDFKSMWRALAPHTARWIGCPLPHSPGIPENTMCAMAHASSVLFEWCSDAPAALRLAQIAAGSNGLVLVVGSHYLVGDVIRPEHFDKVPAGSRQIQELPWAGILRMAQTCR
ncbi:MAG: bifunctional folylpolyglutamate synthase/dihydrofolate synthase [candidate division Zixibacteria bacterium]|nr:bifunctional folylpolyglutamate synthase/dihydrofolate synthase [candidate division Zixibacteria bacterium]